MRNVGWGLSVVFAVFMIGASAAPKLMGASVVAEIMGQLGWPMKYILLIAGLEVGLTVLYLIPATSLLGAVLLTGLLGAAIATNLRVDNPLASHTLFGLYLGAVMWGGLWLRMPGLRAIFPLRR